MKSVHKYLKDDLVYESDTKIIYFFNIDTKFFRSKSYWINIIFDSPSVSDMMVKNDLYGFFLFYMKTSQYYSIEKHSISKPCRWIDLKKFVNDNSVYQNLLKIKNNETV